ncbi:hypothetical protein CKA32_001408 [Geitlerinema sp. FC II]|nr:hypothetical protein CKA32_001408 [Geitlerinema sp. FC II]
MFQSLKGILVNFNANGKTWLLRPQKVSIPQRDFGEFQRRFLNGGDRVLVFQSLKGILVNFNALPDETPAGDYLVTVSIPQRDFGEFQHRGGGANPPRDRQFQSLKGILVNFNSRFSLESDLGEAGFNPSKGFW